MITNLNYNLPKRPYSIMDVDISYIATYGPDDTSITLPWESNGNYQHVSIGMSGECTVYFSGPSNSSFIFYIMGDSRLADESDREKPYILTFNGGSIIPLQEGRYYGRIKGLLYKVDNDYTRCKAGYHSPYIAIGDDTPGTVWTCPEGKVLDIVLPYTYQIGTINLVTIFTSEYPASSEYYMCRVLMPSGGTFRIFHKSLNGRAPWYNNYDIQGGDVLVSLYDPREQYVRYDTGGDIYIERLT